MATLAERGYWTVLVPYVSARFRTEWHPTQADGPFASLSRGAFTSEGDAIEWARGHLRGAPYTLRYVPACEDTRPEAPLQ